MTDNNRYFLREYSTDECRLWLETSDQNHLSLLYWLTWQALGLVPVPIGVGLSTIGMSMMEGKIWYSSQDAPSCVKPRLDDILPKLAEIYPTNILLDLKACLFEDDLGKLLIPGKDLLTASCVMLLVTVRGYDLSCSPSGSPQ